MANFAFASNSQNHRYRTFVDSLWTIESAKAIFLMQVGFAFLEVRGSVSCVRRRE